MNKPRKSNLDQRELRNGTSRRQFLIASAGVASAVSLPLGALGADAKTKIQTKPNPKGTNTMSYLTMKDGTTIYYKDWGSKTGQPVVFSHGWPLSADAWEAQMFFLASHGYRCIAHDRRGHGRSSQPWDGNDMDTYADDLAVLFEALDLKDAVMIGHSTEIGRAHV